MSRHDLVAEFMIRVSFELAEAVLGELFYIALAVEHAIDWLGEAIEAYAQRFDPRGYA